MARKLKSGGILDSIVAVIAVDDDGSTVKCWTTPGASTTTAIIWSGTPPTGSSTTYNGNAAWAFTTSSATTGYIRVDTPISVASPTSGFMAVTSFSGVGANTYLLGQTNLANFWQVRDSSGSEYQYLSFGSGSLLLASGQVLPTDGTDFAIAYSASPSTGTASQYAMYATAGSDLTETDSTTSVTSSNTLQQVDYIFGSGATVLPATVVAFVVFNAAYRATDFNGLTTKLSHDPYGALFESSGVSVAPLAMSAYSRMRNG